MFQSFNALNIGLTTSRYFVMSLINFWSSSVKCSKYVWSFKISTNWWLWNPQRTITIYLSPTFNGTTLSLNRHLCILKAITADEFGFFMYHLVFSHQFWTPSSLSRFTIWSYNNNNDHILFSIVFPQCNKLSRVEISAIMHIKNNISCILYNSKNKSHFILKIYLIDKECIIIICWQIWYIKHIKFNVIHS